MLTLKSMILKVYDDSYKTLRLISKDVDIPLTANDEKLALSLLNHIKASQNQEIREKHKIREGVGLAAPQIGKNKRIIAIHYPSSDGYVTHVLANPKIIKESVRRAFLSNGEGCLSVPRQVDGQVYRHYKVTVKAYDVLKKDYVTINATGYEAIVLQHEIDHLNGILFYDRINPLLTFNAYPDAVEI